ncbi:MAG: cupin domain-containing protein [Synechococcales cyanobacterium]
MPSADEWIAHLGLVPLPEEGGLYRELYRSAEIIPQSALPQRFSGDRCFVTSIYYLLKHPEFSAFHHLQQEELWHFFDGDPLTVHLLYPDGRYEQVRLGRDYAVGETLQWVIPAGVIFAASVDCPGGYSLIGCTVSPGFEFADFAVPSRDQLLAIYPQHQAIIWQLTRS